MVCSFRSTDAVSAVVKGYKTITSLVDKVSGDDNENTKTRSEAQGLAKKMKMLETGVRAELWYRILQRMSMTSKMLQNPTLVTNNAVALLSPLQDFIASQRPQFDLFERCGQDLTSIESFQKKRGRGRTVYDADNTELTARESFKVESFLVITDKLTSAMSDRIGAYSEVCRLFGFLARLEDLNGQALQQAAEQLVHTYKHDLEELLADVLAQVASLLRIPVVKQTCYTDRCQQRTQHVSPSHQTGTRTHFPKC